MKTEFSRQRLLSVRRGKKISQARIAEQANTSIRYIRALEHGEKCNPSFNLILRISDALDVPVTELVTTSEMV